MRLRPLALGLALVSTLALIGCDDPGGNGGTVPPGNQTPTPTQTNKVDAEVTEPSGQKSQVDGEQAQPAEGTFGAGIAGTVLNLWMTSGTGTLISVVIDTASFELPATVNLGEINSAAFVSMTQALPAPAVYNSFASSGSITIHQCPKAASEALTGSFNNIKLASEADGTEVTLSGTFNLMVGPIAGALQCKAVVTPQPDAGTTDTVQDTSTGPTCDNSEECDTGACCPYVECWTGCSIQCAFGSECMGGDPVQCNTCIMNCWDSCGASAACKSAATAAQQCSDQSGCTELEDEAQDACMGSSCCSQMKALF